MTETQKIYIYCEHTTATCIKEGESASNILKHLHETPFLNVNGSGSQAFFRTCMLPFLFYCIFNSKSFISVMHSNVSLSRCVCVCARVCGPSTREVNLACRRGCVSGNLAMQSHCVCLCLCACMPWTCHRGDDERWLLQSHPSVVAARDGCCV